jgi:hypothetical protein
VEAVELEPVTLLLKTAAQVVDLTETPEQQILLALTRRELLMAELVMEILVE